MANPKTTAIESDLVKPGAPLRMRDVMAITGLSRKTIIAEMERCELVGFRILARPGSPWLFERAVVAAWWDTKRLDLAS